MPTTARRAFRAGGALFALAVIAWGVISLLPTPATRAAEQVERQAGMHHDQHEPAQRFYVPTSAHSKNGVAVLRYRVHGSQDSCVRDFLRTYEIKAEPQNVTRLETTYSDDTGNTHRLITVAYEHPAAPGKDTRSDNTAARITVTARPPTDG
ncbi:hypothetical protein QOM21_17705 [Streptomyces sp. Pv4-95]|uniref:hypothetical protein n=1 Tax=Streptomyces sp. Pv4-95 TaxID=3049543 RepID=UPI003891C988